MSITINVILDTRRMKIKTKNYPVKLRVTHKRVTRDYPSVINLSVEDYKKLSAPRINLDLQSIRDKIKMIHREAEDFISDLDIFSFNEFERDFINNHELFKQRKKVKEQENSIGVDALDYSSYYKRFPLFTEDHSRPGSISIVFLAYIKILLQENRIGTALSYQQSYNSLKKFRGNVLFAEINVGFLNQYERWMLQKDCSKTTVGIKIRALRAIFNQAIEMRIIRREKCYPFGRRKYQIPLSRNIKKALDPEQLKAIYFYEPNSPELKKAKDFWLFSYFGNGMNPKDIIYLKNKDLQDDYITFIRSKTERTTRNDPKPITIYITEDMRKIIETRRNKDSNPHTYLFPFMSDDLHPLKQYELVTAFTDYINNGMAKIAQHLGIDKKITTIVSRHSFSTQLKRSGASTEFIQEALGHTDKRTTENYLDSFSKEVKKQYAHMLVSFR